MFSNIAVTTAEIHPLYKTLTETYPKAASNSDEDFRAKLQGYGMTPNPEPGILWNFEKFVIGRDGQIVARFAPNVPPNDPIVLQAIEKALVAA